MRLSSNLLSSSDNSRLMDRTATGKRKTGLATLPLLPHLVMKPLRLYLSAPNVPRSTPAFTHPEFDSQDSLEVPQHNWRLCAAKLQSFNFQTLCCQARKSGDDTSLPWGRDTCCDTTFYVRCLCSGIVEVVTDIGCAQVRLDIVGLVASSTANVQQVWIRYRCYMNIAPTLRQTNPTMIAHSEP